MHSQNPQPDFVAELDDRRIIRFTGADAGAFLNNMMTNDLASVDADNIVYSCFLSPQGQFLHDFFVLSDGADYLVDIDAARADDFLKRLGIFKLRAKVDMTFDEKVQVYAGAGGRADPRHAALGGRSYLREPRDAVPRDMYDDYCIHLGIPLTTTVRPEREVLADVNIDLLHAVAWDKGCYIGQEVTARMRYKALSKRRLFIVQGRDIETGKISQDGVEAGDIRSVNSLGTEALAVVKLAAADKKDSPLTDSGNNLLVIKTPDYMDLATALGNS
jgi:folate-binding protein YgfZ